MPTRKVRPAKTAPAVEPPSYEGPWYAIDPKWYEEHSVSLEEAIRARRGPLPKSSSSKMSRSRNKAAKTAPSWEREMKALAESIARQPGYVTSDTPLLEAVFRTLLAEKNRPLALQELVELIRQRYAVGELPRDVSAPLLQRMLERQGAYGIAQVSDGAAQKGA